MFINALVFSYFAPFYAHGGNPFEFASMFQVIKVFCVCIRGVDV